MRGNFATLLTGEQIESRLREIAADLVAEKIPSGSGEILLVPIMAGAERACGKLRGFLEEELKGKTFAASTAAISEKPLYIQRSVGTLLLKPSLVNFPYTEKDFAGKTVVIVDDLVDEGLTLKLAHETIARFSPLRLVTVVVVKKSDIHTDGWLDYSAFQLCYPLEKARKRWLFGYGMDIDGEGRDLDFIGEISL